VFKGEFAPFFQGSAFTVKSVYGHFNEGNQERPEIDIDNVPMFYAIKLAKAGFYGGNPQAVLRAPVNIVMNIINYEAFEGDYEAEYRAIVQRGDL
jgi:hypothetical protein